MKKQSFTIIMIVAVSILFVGCTEKSEVSLLPKSTSVLSQSENDENNEPAQESEETDYSDEKQKLLYGTELLDGVYKIEAESSSSMFRIIDANLIVKNETMLIQMTLSGTGYLRLYMGTKEQAAEAPEENFIYYTENNEGQYIYEIPIEALNQDIACAAWSIKKEQWYDRTLVFWSKSLPPEAFANQETVLKDGKYQINVFLTGGTGRANVISPAVLNVTEGKIFAEIKWNSPNYDYMIVNENKYLPVNTAGDAVFEIAIENLEYDLNVIANTTAMSQPHEIEYTISFDLNSVEPME